MTQAPLDEPAASGPAPRSAASTARRCSGRRPGLPKLAAQIAQTLDWAACLEGVREFGASRVLELGPGHALATMARASLPEAQVHAIEDFRSIAGITDWIREA